MTSAAPLARYGAMWRRASRAAPLPPVSYTTTRDTTGDLLSKIVDGCLQLFRGYGYMTEYPIGEVMKVLIGRGLLQRS